VVQARQQIFELTDLFDVVFHPRPGLVVGEASA